MCTSGRCSSNPGNSSRLENKTGFNQNSAGLAGHAMLFPSVLLACNQAIVSLLPKPPGKMPAWFHQSLSWTLRPERKNFDRPGIELFPVDYHDVILCSSAPFFFWLCMFVSEREMCLHVFSKRVALIHLSISSIDDSTHCNCQARRTAAVDVNSSQQLTLSGPAGYC